MKLSGSSARLAGFLAAAAACSAGVFLYRGNGLSSAEKDTVSALAIIENDIELDEEERLRNLAYGSMWASNNNPSPYGSYSNRKSPRSSPYGGSYNRSPYKPSYSNYKPSKPSGGYGSRPSYYNPKPEPSYYNPKPKPYSYKPKPRPYSYKPKPEPRPSYYNPKPRPSYPKPPPYKSPPVYKAPPPPPPPPVYKAPPVQYYPEPEPAPAYHPQQDKNWDAYKTPGYKTDVYSGYKGKGSYKSPRRPRSSYKHPSYKPPGQGNSGGYIDDPSQCGKVGRGRGLWGRDYYSGYSGGGRQDRYNSGYKKSPRYGGGGRGRGGGKEGGIREPTYQDYLDVEAIIQVKIDESNCRKEDCGCFKGPDGKDPLAARLIRMAFHDSTGYCDGFVNMHDPENFGLECALEVLDEVYNMRFLNSQDLIRCVISRADLYVWAYYAAVRSGANQQAEDVDKYIPTFVPTWGRRTYHPSGPNDLGPQERFPEMGSMSNGDMLQTYFREWYDFDERQTTTIMGAHTMGMARIHNSKHQAPWTRDTHVYNEEFYKNVLEFPWRMIRVTKTTWQWSLCDESGCFGLMLTPDISLCFDVDHFICKGDGTQMYQGTNTPCLKGDLWGAPPSRDDPENLCKWQGEGKGMFAFCYPEREACRDVKRYAAIENRRLWIDDFVDVYQRMLRQRVNGELIELHP